ncbi:helix-turn-helix transcriptional regulator [uncultured Methylobacterium sp.]|uniref:helix-turn-helix domain-containing protein n=1 Tax=uncultured Methylobacterium sp. TaxID=157278 RepID=UPI002635386F|nr:helix-turn-helix transcriptional regulator [uncultured Methylobacterium sp.]
MAGRPADERDARIGERVEQLRLTRRISRETLAAHLGMSPSQLGKYLKGSNRLSATDLLAISHALAMPIDYFLDGIPRLEPLVAGFGERPQAPIGGDSWPGFAGAVADAAGTHLDPARRRDLAAMVQALDRALALR